MRIHQVLGLIEEYLNEFKPLVKVVEHYVEEGEEYVNVRVRLPRFDAAVIIREYWQGNDLVAYGYYVRVRGHEEWWDNRPHHPEIPSYPHHRHVGGKVHPLQNPSLHKFLERVRELLLNEKP